MNNDSRSFEDELMAAKADIAVIRSNYATKADLANLRLDLLGEIHAQGEQLQEKIRVEGEQLRGEIQTNSAQLEGSLRREIQAASAQSRLESQAQAERTHGESEAVRAELYKAMNAQTWKLIASVAAIVTAVNFLARAY
jgi:hypothetical protein